MQADPQSQANRYRRQAEHLRRAVELIVEAGLREQLLSIALQYETAAASIEEHLRLRTSEAGIPEI
jgi:hypothetical protein